MGIFEKEPWSDKSCNYHRENNIDLVTFLLNLQEIKIISNMFFFGQQGRNSELREYKGKAIVIISLGVVFILWRNNRKGAWIKVN